MRIPVLPVLLAGLLAAAGAAEARTLKVPSDDHPTIQSALDAAADGDTVSIAPGTYDENLVLEGATKVKIKGKKGVVVQPEGGVVLDLSGCTDVTVQGLNLKGGSTGVRMADCTRTRLTKLVVENTSGSGLDMNESNGTKVSKCEFRNIGQYGIIDSGSDDLVVDRNTFTDCNSAGFSLSAYNYETEGGSNRAKVTKNVVDGASRGASFGGDGILIDRNRFENLTGAGIEFGSSTTISGSVVRRNTITTAGGTCIFINGDDQRVEKNTLNGGQYGVVTYSPRMSIKSNRLNGQALDGIGAHGEENRVEKNTVEGAGRDGVVLTGSTPTASKNKINGSTRHGILVQSTGGTITGNKVTGSGSNGGRVEESGNTLTKNTFTGSGEEDLLDTAGEGANTYVKNKPDPTFPQPI